VIVTATGHIETLTCCNINLSVNKIRNCGVFLRVLPILHNWTLFSRPY